LKHQDGYRMLEHVILQQYNFAFKITIAVYITHILF